jgi:hypothetical protein
MLQWLMPRICTGADFDKEREHPLKTKPGASRAGPDHTSLFTSAGFAFPADFLGVEASFLRWWPACS